MSQDPIRPATPRASALINRLLRAAEPPKPVQFPAGPVANRRRRRAIEAIKRGRKA